MKFKLESYNKEKLKSKCGVNHLSSNSEMPVIVYDPCRVWPYCHKTRTDLGIVSYVAKQGKGEYLSDSNLKDLLDNIYCQNTYFNCKGQSVVPAVLIHADTGIGKTKFVIDTFCNTATTSSKVLILCNRTGLLVQERLELIKNVKSINAEYSSCNFNAFQLRNKTFTSLENIDVMMYQQFVNNYNKLDIKQYSAIICDEVHYLISDSVFNGTTEKVLQIITQMFKQTKRIYITATPYEIAPVLASYEDTIMGQSIDINIDNFNLIRFYVKPYRRNYVLKSIEWSSNENKLTENIYSALALKEGEKILIFVDSKNFGNTLVEYFKGKNLSVTYLDKDEKESENYKTLIEECRFKSDVLITTSVSYNGINIHMKEVRHIIVFSMDQVEYLQSIGCVRIDESYDPINIYLIDFDKSYISKRLNYLRRSLSECYEAQRNPQAYTARHLGDTPPVPPVYYDYENSKTYVNALAIRKFESDIEYCQFLMEQYEIDPHICLNEQKKWLKSFISKKQIDGYSYGQSKIINLLEKNIDKCFTKDNIYIICDKVRDLAKKYFGYTEQNPGEHFTPAKSNNIFKEHNIPYIIDNGRKYINILRT